MTPAQLELIPELQLRHPQLLLEWLEVRGWRMTLLELDTERRRRGITQGRNTA